MEMGYPKSFYDPVYKIKHLTKLNSIDQFYEIEDNENNVEIN